MAIAFDSLKRATYKYDAEQTCISCLRIKSFW